MCLKSTFQGSTPFTIRWFKGDKELVSGGSCYINKEALESSLELYAVKTTDSGTYTCKVSNVAGAVECSANLFVKGLQNFLDIFELPTIVSSCLFLTSLNDFLPQNLPHLSKG